MFTRTRAQVQDWSESSLTTYLDAHQRDPLEALVALVSELEVLAERDLFEAYRRARSLHWVCWGRVKDQARRLGLPEAWQLDDGYVVRQQEGRARDLAFGLNSRCNVELFRRQRARRPRGRSRLLIDRGGA